MSNRPLPPGPRVPITPDNPKTDDWSPEQLAYIQQERDYWDGVATDTRPIDREAATAAVHAFCRRMNQPITPLFFAPGPWAAHVAIAYWRQYGYEALVKATTPEPTTTKKIRTVYGKMEKELTKAGIRVRYAWTWFWGQHEARWVGRYRTAERLGVVFSPDELAQLEEFEAICENTGWWWPYQHGHIIMDRPTIMRWERFGDAGRIRPHAEDGVAVQYLDGWSAYAWHGIRLTGGAEKAVTDGPTLKMIQKETNAEVRRALIGLYGYDKWILDTGAQCVQQDDFGKLYEIPLDENRTIKVVRVVNGTPEPGGETRPDCEQGSDGEYYKVYWLRTLSTVTSAHEAVAQSFEMTVEDYDPIFRT